MSERIRVVQTVDAVDSGGSVVARLDPGEYALISQDATWATLRWPDGRDAFVVVVGVRTLGEPDPLAHDPAPDHPAW